MARKRVGSQLELAGALAEAGCEVTQATISRDIRELGLRRSTTRSAGRVRAADRADRRRRDHRTRSCGADAVRSADRAAQNLVVVHSELGSRPRSRALDRAEHERVVGTLAGDDTCLVITRDEKDAQALAAQLPSNGLGGRRSAHGRASSSCAASRISVASANGAPIICTPTGRPSSLQWSGTDVAGWPVTLTIAVKGVHCALP